MLCYWFRLEIMVALQAAILTFLGFAYMKQIFQFNPMDEVTVSLLCCINFKIRHYFFDIKEFLKTLLHTIDLCSQVVVKEVSLITILTIKTYLQLITIRSKDYLQFISIKHSFQLIITIKITMIMIISIIIIIISCYSNGYIGDLPGVFSVWYELLFTIHFD